MSLTNFTKAFSINFTPKLNTESFKTQGSSDPPQIDPVGNMKGDYTELSTVKIIPDDNDVSTENQQLANPEHQTRVRIDRESQKIIIEVVDEKTGKEVRQIPGEQQLRLNEEITEYNKILFKQSSKDHVEKVNPELQEKNRSK